VRGIFRSLGGLSGVCCRINALAVSPAASDAWFPRAFPSMARQVVELRADRLGRNRATDRCARCYAVSGFIEAPR
jgi:hypothetical protein